MNRPIRVRVEEDLVITVYPCEGERRVREILEMAQWYREGGQRFTAALAQLRTPEERAAFLGEEDVD